MVLCPWRSWCYSAWGPNADRRGKSLKLLGMLGSKFGVDSQRVHRTPKKRGAGGGGVGPPIPFAAAVRRGDGRLASRRSRSRKPACLAPGPAPLARCDATTAEGASLKGTPL